MIIHKRKVWIKLPNYLLKYKSKYRLLPELDKETNDFLREVDGSIIDDDVYISCYNNNKIFVWGHDTNGRVLLQAYIPSLIRGRHIKKDLDEKCVPYTNYFETDEEVIFRFKPKDIEIVATLLKVRTNGASISPFSVRNLPKSNVEIPSDQIEKYKAVIADVQKGDLLLISRLTDAFLSNILNKKYRKEEGRKFDYQTDIRKMKMSRMKKEYIYIKNMFDEYLVYLQKGITKFYKNK